MISPTLQADETTTKTWTVVISRGQSRNPAKRATEQSITDAAAEINGAHVIVVPHLYDLPKGGESLQKLAAIEGNLIVVSWIFPRAAHWVLDRNGVRGQFVAVELGDPAGDDAEQDQDASASDSNDRDDVERVDQLYPRPEREIHCIDLKLEIGADEIIAEIQRLIQADSATAQSPSDPNSLPIIGGQIVQVDEDTSRRWYPVIDFSRCTNCMECVDFCLFGVYGVDGAETILVEQPDNCRKGCPACSRVCPENAIIFPQHKAPAIAGAETGGSEAFKIDLSKLFGAPEGSDDAIATAARERDEQLLLVGRDAIGIDDQLQRRQADLQAKPKDELDRLIDSLDELDL
ncbi:ferredoxin family protein [Stieleria sp. TO1_6]|uniref:4Fe-4S dicluster domain-containing protein n=1 Tax=Stieleria tagensis TaxID=2956795 RepID=UPI00209AA5D5|nr:ferredoxin family protein [Stieleria tagensis]MCO8122445.1 ferredoxin family protein [Stieleria tagensis]